MSESRKINYTLAIVALAAGIGLGVLGTLHWPWRSNPSAAVTQKLATTFEARIQAPSTLSLTDQSNTAWLKFEFQTPDKLNYFPLTIKNLTHDPLSVSYRILGYDSKDQRISEGDDHVDIGVGESVRRQVMLVTQGLPFGEAGASFKLVAEIQH